MASHQDDASTNLLVEWILESWNRLDKSFIINSFKSCALNLKSDGSEDHLIHCFKDNQPCATGSNMLKEQQNLLMKAEHLNSNPFQITDSDTEEANAEADLIDPSNDFIDID